MEKSDKKNPESGKCHECTKHLSESTTMMAEGADYVYHFCGEDCYQKWQRAQKETLPGEN